MQHSCNHRQQTNMTLLDPCLTLECKQKLRNDGIHIRHCLHKARHYYPVSCVGVASECQIFRFIIESQLS